MRRKALCSGALVWLVLACSTVEESQNPEAALEVIPEGVASVSFAQLGNFSGNSVRIFGDRFPVADEKYPCASMLDQCFNFNEDGTLVEGPVQGLCPSVNVPQGNWTFNYEIFTDVNCTGEILNLPGNENNFQCFDSTAVATLSNPNQSVDEELLIGGNANFIVCLSEGAEKFWDFSSCLVEAPGVYNCCRDLAPDGLCFDCNMPGFAVDGCGFDPVTCVLSCF